MITTTTFGTWLPGDLRGYVDDGIILPGNPALLAHAKAMIKGAAVYLSRDEQAAALDGLIAGASEFQYRLIAASIESWHVHFLIDHGFDSVAVMVGRLKTRMRQAIRSTRIWTAGYDSRYCFEEREVQNRWAYINRHAGSRKLPPPHGNVPPTSFR